MSTTSPRGEAQLRKLACTQLNVTPAPGQTAKRVAATEVVRAGERCLAAEDFSGALRIGEQLRKSDGLASEGLRSNETERTVKTASRMQVRKPLYQSSIGALEALCGAS